MNRKTRAAIFATTLLLAFLPRTDNASQPKPDARITNKVVEHLLILAYLLRPPLERNRIDNHVHSASASI